MKKYIIVILLCLSSTVIQSQIISGYGVKCGLVSSKADLDIKPSSIYSSLDNWFEDRRVGVTFGVFLNMFDTKYFDVQSELSYYEEGAQDEIPVTTVDNPDGSGEYLTFDHEYDFLKLNINIRPKFKVDNITPYLLIGPSINYLLKDRGGFYLENIDKVHFGYSYGLGVTIENILNNSFIIEFKNNGYFNDLVNNDDEKVTLNSWQINFGILLN